MRSTINVVCYKAIRLSYIRKKTKKKIEFPIIESAMRIIDKYNCSLATGYTFPILDDNVHKTDIQKYNRIHKVMRKVNVALKQIPKEINQEINLTTYVAKHSIYSFHLQTNDLHNCRFQQVTT